MKNKGAYGFHAHNGAKARAHKNKKLYISKLGSCCRLYGLSFASLISKLKEENIKLNREILPLLAIYEPMSLKAVINRSQHQSPSKE
jgi:ribosomal protein L20